MSEIENHSEVVNEKIKIENLTRNRRVGSGRSQIAVFCVFLPFLVKKTKTASGDPGSKFYAGIFGDIFLEFCNQNIEKMTWKNCSPTAGLGPAASKFS